MVSKVFTIKNGIEGENAYLVASTDGKALIIDPGNDAPLIIEQLRDNQLTPIAILATHAHWDHISAVEALVSHFKIPFFIHKNEQKLLKSLNLYRMLVAKMEFVKIPKIDFELISENPVSINSFEIMPFLIGTHTSGSCFIQINQHLFTGDILYKNVLDGDTKKSDDKKLKMAIGKLSNLAEEIIIYPGHGSQTTLTEELNHNLDLQKKLI